MVIMGKEPIVIEFNDIIKYEWGIYYNSESLSIWLLDGKKINFVNSAILKENGLFITAIKNQIEELIASGKLPMTRRFQWPFIKSKWTLAILISYTVIIFFYTRNQEHLTFELKIILLLAFSIGFIAWGTYISISLMNKKIVSYKRKVKKMK